MMKVYYYPLIFSIFFSCSIFEEDEEEEFDYYEPIIGEELQTVSDVDKKVEYEYNLQERLIVETEDPAGIVYSIEIPPGAMMPTSSESFYGYIVPLTGIQNLPQGVEFQFGLEIEPYGIRFIKPVEIKIILPADFSTQNLRGFYNEGLGGIAYLEPLKIKRSSSGTVATFEVLHFSSYGAIRVADNDFDCPNPRSAQSCENLREIVACTLGSYEVGINEELNQQDKEAVNYMLRSWMEEQLKYINQEDSDFTDIYEFEYELSQYVCWKAMTQEFNSYPESVFGDLFDQAEDYIVRSVGEIMGELDASCLDDLNDGDCLEQVAVANTRRYLDWLALAQLLGIENHQEIINLFNFCNSSVTEIMINFTMVKPGSLIEFDHDSETENYKAYYLVLETPEQIVTVDYVMLNLMDEMVHPDDSEIVWVDVTQDDGAFIYENRTVSMKSEAIEAINLCESLSPDDCLDYLSSKFEIHQKGCYVATVFVIWSRY